MADSELPEQPNIKTKGGNYNERIEGDYIQQQGSFGIAANKGEIKAEKIAGTIYETPIERNIQARTVNIYELKDSKYNSDQDQPSNKHKQVDSLVITLDGIDYDKFLGDKEIQEAILLLLQKASGDTSVNFKKIEKGSIKITLDGSPEGLKRLVALIKSGELGELKEDLDKLGLSIEDAKLVVKDATEENENTEDKEKSRLVQEFMRDLNDANLSDADLANHNPSGEILRIVSPVARAFSIFKDTSKVHQQKYLKLTRKMQRPKSAEQKRSKKEIRHKYYRVRVAGAKRSDVRENVTETEEKSTEKEQR